MTNINNKSDNSHDIKKEIAKQLLKDTQLKTIRIDVLNEAMAIQKELDFILNAKK